MDLFDSVLPIEVVELILTQYTSFEDKRKLATTSKRLNAMMPKPTSAIPALLNHTVGEQRRCCSGSWPGLHPDPSSQTPVQVALMMTTMGQELVEFHNASDRSECFIDPALMMVSGEEQISTHPFTRTIVAGQAIEFRIECYTSDQLQSMRTFAGERFAAMVSALAADLGGEVVEQVPDTWHMWVGIAHGKTGTVRLVVRDQNGLGTCFSLFWHGSRHFD